MGWRIPRTVRAIVACGIVASSPIATLAAAPDAVRCPPSGDAIVVDTQARELWLCASGAAPARFAVALGRSGVGKRRRGDGRTPLGTYALGAPRPSREYGTFIPIGYPTAQQTAEGFSGTAVGIHGPPRGMDATRYPVTDVDWTLGCIATGTDREAREIAEFVRERHPAIVIR